VLALLNGWASSQSQYGSGDPRAAIQNGVVYLSGSMHQAAPGLERFAILPRRFRPSRNLWLPVYSFGGAVGSIEIAASGRMTASGTGATAYTSLGGVSFPVTSVRLHNLSLLDGWTSSQSEFGSGDPQAGIRNGIVYLAGSMHQASGTSNRFATLPKRLRPAHDMWFPVPRAFRPAHNMWLPIFTSGGLFGSIEIASSGRMYAFGGGVTGYTGLAGISFPANS
jgi:hypothetical protein